MRGIPDLEHLGVRVRSAKPNQKMNDRVSFISHSKKLTGKWLLSLVQMFNDVSTNVSEVLLS